MNTENPIDLFKAANRAAAEAARWRKLPDGVLLWKVRQCDAVAMRRRARELLAKETPCSMTTGHPFIR